MSNICGEILIYTAKTTEFSHLQSSHSVPCIVAFAAVKCEELTRPRNGVMFVTGITFGSTVAYNCDVGFELVGVSSRTCQSNGVWSDSDPTCRRINTGPGINCGDPGVPSNGRRTGDNFGVRSTVTYQCNRGFVLVGSSSRTCQESGQWSGSLPTCKICESSSASQ